MLIQYSLSAITAFSGIIAGIILAFLTKEEMRVAERYMVRFQQALLLAITGSLIYVLKPPLFPGIAVFAVISIAVLLKPSLNYFPLLAFVFFLSAQDPLNLFTVSALIFLYGFPVGSLLFIKNKETSLPGLIKKAVFRYGIFVVLCIGFQLLYRVFILKKTFWPDS